MRERYAHASKKDRQHILDEFVATTGYHRKHAIALLRGKRSLRDRTQPIRRLRRRFYSAEDQRAVLWLAELLDQIGSKRLPAAMDVERAQLYQHKQLRVTRRCYQTLQIVSPASLPRPAKESNIFFHLCERLVR